MDGLVHEIDSGEKIFITYRWRENLNRDLGNIKCMKDEDNKVFLKYLKISKR